MKEFLKSKWFTVLIMMFILITLFPLYHWDINNSLSNRRNILKSGYGKLLPIKKYDFIFNSSVKSFAFEYWGWDYRTEQSEIKEFEILLKRNMIIDELILHYILSSLIVFLLYKYGIGFKLLYEKVKSKRKTRKIFYQHSHPKVQLQKAPKVSKVPERTICTNCYKENKWTNEYCAECGELLEK